MPASQPTRRSVLASFGLLAAGGTATGLATGCAEDKPERPDPVTALVDRMAAQERRLLARSRATAARHQQVADRLVAVTAAHRAHLEALGQPAGPPRSGKRGTASAEPEATSRGGAPVVSPTPTVPKVPASAAKALAVLAGEERAASKRLAEGLVDAPEPLARLLASMGASAAGNHLLLTSRSGQ